MASPQLENGYTKIANELLLALCKLDIKGCEFMIALTVLSKTYRWNKKEDRISLTQFQEITGLSRPRVVRSIKNLVRYNVLGSNRGDTTTSSTYWIEKNYDKWTPSNRPDTSNRLVTRGSTKTPKKVVTRLLHTKETTKETIKRNILSGKPDPTQPILYLNTKCGTSFSTKAKVNIALIRARFAEGRTLDDFKKVIDRKHSQWSKDEKMCQYLRPKTLFNATNFENYLNEKGDPHDGLPYHLRPIKSSK